MADFDHPAVKYALEGKWLTLALSRFAATYSTKTDFDHFAYFDDPKAYGVVHVDFRLENLIRCELTLDRTSGEPPANNKGIASLTVVNDDDDPHIMLQVSISDPRGKLERALQAAFDSAALSQDKFVHISFRREQLDVDAVLMELKEKKFGGYHPLTEISLKRQTILPRAPGWSWVWSTRP